MAQSVRSSVTAPLIRYCSVAALMAAICSPAFAYHAADGLLADKTIVLTGRALTPSEVVQVARHGARVALSAEARERSADAFGLLLEAATEGVPVYWFNRGSGAGRESVIFSGDPDSPANRQLLEQRQLEIFRSGATNGVGPEVEDEEIVRAMMVVRANTMTYEAASPALTQMLIDLLNHRITPVVRSRGTVGEGDLGPLMNVAATMVGAGQAYYHGERLDAGEALRREHLIPLSPFAADDSALTSSNSYATGQAALLVADAEAMLDWADLAYAIDLNGMNSSITPLSLPVQANRPFPWLNWHARRMLGLLRGSYLFERDSARIIQDPESLRASSIRQASAWQSWAALAQSVQLQINTSDHNPAVRVGLSPSDAWELETPQLSQFYVRGGRHSHGQHGYIVSNANWDPYPLVNDIEAFTIAVANMDAAITQRISRFTNPFFTVMKAPNEHGWGRWGGGFATSSLMQEIQGLAMPVPPEGNAIVQTVEDMQSQSRIKVARARAAVDDSVELLAEDVLTGSYWLEQRASGASGRTFGAASDLAFASFETAVINAEASQADALHDSAANFLKTHSAATFFPADSALAATSRPVAAR
jgi:histidine ammonia-lyase